MRADHTASCRRRAGSRGPRRRDIRGPKVAARRLSPPRQAQRHLVVRPSSFDALVHSALTCGQLRIVDRASALRSPTSCALTGLFASGRRARRGCGRAASLRVRASGAGTSRTTISRHRLLRCRARPQAPSPARMLRGTRADRPTARLQRSLAARFGRRFRRSYGDADGRAAGPRRPSHRRRRGATAASRAAAARAACARAGARSRRRSPRDARAGGRQRARVCSRSQSTASARCLRSHAALVGGSARGRSRRAVITAVDGRANALPTSTFSSPKRVGEDCGSAPRPTAGARAPRVVRGVAAAMEAARKARAFASRRPHRNVAVRAVGRRRRARWRARRRFKPPSAPWRVRAAGAALRGAARAPAPCSRAERSFARLAPDSRRSSAGAAPCSRGSSSLQRRERRGRSLDGVASRLRLDRSNSRDSPSRPPPRRSRVSAMRISVCRSCGASRRRSPSSPRAARVSRAPLERRARRGRRERLRAAPPVWRPPRRAARLAIGRPTRSRARDAAAEDHGPRRLDGARRSPPRVSHVAGTRAVPRERRFSIRRAMRHPDRELR